MNIARTAQSIPPREETQRKLDLRAAAAALIKPSDHYTLADRLEEQVDRLGEHDFLVYGDLRLSYAAFDQRANRVAQAALASGLRPGDVCAFALENRPEFFSVWFGLAKIGVVVAFINNQISGRPLVHALECTDAKAVIVGEECAQNFHETDGIRVPMWLLPDPEKPAPETVLQGFDRGFMDALEQASDTRVERSHRAHITAETPALMIFTSGTTGLPKAAIYSHMRWLCTGDVMGVTIHPTPEDVFYCCLPLYHGAAATSVTSTALKAGASIVLRRKFSVSRFWDDICSNNVTICQYIGEICRYLLNQDTRCTDHTLRVMMGAGLSEKLWRRWIERFGDMGIFEGWGSTESNTNIINVDNHVGACGRIPDWSKTNLRIVRYDIESDEYIRDENGYLMLCEPNEVGEGIGMIINHPDTGGGRFEGYTSREASEQKILRNVFSEGDSWWRSGDLLRCDEHGFIYFIDRIGDTFRWKSENVSTQEVAGALSDFKGAELINIYGVKVPEHEGRAGMAAIVMQNGATFDPKAFYDLTTERLPSYAVPLFVRVGQEADLTTTFKLRKVDIQRQGYSPEYCSDPLYVRNDKTGTYEPYSLSLLNSLGLPPFEHE
ncbi:long-chain-acyl-CoA synthetase [Marinobacterium weihaiense]|uniref:Long-chain-acyl-CoA synthetase n=1 Tax=Marinobacterium weihaiense TaxID=2851016 RepID=A0ABS6M686_9GAMM|nr:long-chain-acyl-CoA synthetase [Marinobacterium weihaiense]MBV0931735.1 long-chain-acyl-CoA synthetase [Marinobacterium weihaiense]